MSDLVERVAKLRDAVLDGDGAASSEGCAELFEAVLSALTLGSESVAGIEVAAQDVVARRLAWGDSEARLLEDMGWLFDRVLAVVADGVGDDDEQMVVIEAVTQVSSMVSRAIALSALARAARDRAARVREQMAQRQLRDAVRTQRERLGDRSEDL
jgi:hypothetical protein